VKAERVRLRLVQPVPDEQVLGCSDLLNKIPNTRYSTRFSIVFATHQGILPRQVRARPAVTKPFFRIVNAPFVGPVCRAGRGCCAWGVQLRRLGLQRRQAAYKGLMIPSRCRSRPPGDTTRRDAMAAGGGCQPESCRVTAGGAVWRRLAASQSGQQVVRATRGSLLSPREGAIGMSPVRKRGVMQPNNTCQSPRTGAIEPRVIINRPAGALWTSEASVSHGLAPEATIKRSCRGWTIPSRHHTSDKLSRPPTAGGAL